MIDREIHSGKLNRVAIVVNKVGTPSGKTSCGRFMKHVKPARSKIDPSNPSNDNGKAIYYTYLESFCIIWGLGGQTHSNTIDLTKSSTTRSTNHQDEMLLIESGTFWQVNQRQQIQFDRNMKICYFPKISGMYRPENSETMGFFSVYNLGKAGIKLKNTLIL